MEQRSHPARNVLAILAAVLAVLLLAAAVLFLWPWMRQSGRHLAALTPNDIHSFVHLWGPWSAAGSIFLMVLHSILPIPAEFIGIANGMMFGPWLGVAITWVGAMLGAVLSFALARWLGMPVVRRILSPERLRHVERISAHPTSLLLVRLVPVISFNLVNYAAGLLGVPWRRFVWTTAIGILPLTIVVVVAGDRLATAAWRVWTAVIVGGIALWIALRWLRRHEHDKLPHPHGKRWRLRSGRGL